MTRSRKWTQEHSYSLSGDGGLAVYTYQNNAESAVSVSLDNIQLTKNEGETIFQEDFNASADGAAGYFDKVDLIQDGSGTDDKKAELQEENVARLSSQAEGFSGIQYVNYNYQNNIAQLKIKFAEDFEAAELTDGVYVAPVGTGIRRIRRGRCFPANGGTLSVRIQKPRRSPSGYPGGRSCVHIARRLVSFEDHDAGGPGRRREPYLRQDLERTGKGTRGVEH